MAGFQPFETMPDMSKFLFAGLDQARKDREKREKSKAMKDLFSSVSTLFKDEIPNWNPSSAQDLTPLAEPAPAGIPSGAPSPIPAASPSAGPPMPAAGAPAPSGFPPVVGMPPLSPEQIAKAKESFAKMSPEDQAKAMEAGKQAMGVPSGPTPPAAGPSPGMLNLQPPPPAGLMSPVGPAMPPGMPLGAPGQDPNALRAGIMNSLAQTSGDYAPEAVAAIHSLFSVSPFKDTEGRDVYSAAPGSVVMDKKGRTLFKVPEKADEAGIKKAEIGAGATVKAAKIGAGSREAAAKIRGKWQYKSAVARANAARTVAKIRLTAGDRINSPAKLYTYLSQKFLDGTLQPAEKEILNHLEPVIIKMGGLQTLLDMQSGVSSNPPPWGGNEPAETPDPEVQQEVGWWGSLFNGAPGTTTPVVPAPIAKKTPGKAAPAKAPAVGPGFSIGGQKLTAPTGYSDADIQMTMDSMQAKLKEGYSKDQLFEHLRKKGWKVQ